MDACGTCIGGTSNLTAQTWYEDADNDSWGNSNVTKYCNNAGSGWVLRGGDFNDNCYNVANDGEQCIDSLLSFCAGMSAVEKQAINKGLTEMKTDHDTDFSCGRIYIYNSVKSCMNEIEMCIDGATNNNGSYNPVTKKITFSNLASSVVSTMAHELFHAMQDNCGSYSGGVSQYVTGTRDGYPNIEFEAVLYEDILNGSFQTAAAFATGNSDDKQDYTNFLNSITINKTVKPTSFTSTQMQEYYRLVERYNQHRGYGGITRTNLPPNAMFNMFDNLDCN